MRRSLSRAQRIIEAAKAADIAIGLENAADDPATAVTARRSSGRWQVKVTAKSAHSSQIFSDDVGAGAIYELSRILNAFYEELRGEQYLTFNPGLVVGQHAGRLHARAAERRSVRQGQHHRTAGDRLRRPARHHLAADRRHAGAHAEDRGGASAAYDGGNHVRQRLSADGPERRQSQIVVDVRRRSVAISATERSLRSTRAAPAPRTFHSRPTMSTWPSTVWGCSAAARIRRKNSPTCARSRSRRSAWRCCCSDLGEEFE